MATTSRYYDGDYAVGFYDGPPLITYPFINNTTPDRYAKQIRRTWKQRGVDYVPANANRTSFTNITLQSQTLGQSPWATNYTLTVTENAATAPDGTTTANLLVDTSANNADRYQYSTVANDSNAHTASVFLKKLTATESQFIFALEGGTSVSSFSYINWTTGVVTYTGTGTTTLTDCGDGWLRLTTSLTNNSSGNVNALLRIVPDSSSPSATGAVYVWGAQIVAGSIAGPYIPTTTISRTVSAPDMDPGDEINEADQLAYLVAESEQDRDISDTVRVQRNFSRIPQPQTTPTFLRISKPSISGTFPQAFGDFRIFQPDATLQKFDAYAAQTVTSDSGAPSVYPTGGTYTLTFRGNTTTALAYNANAGVAEAAFEILASVVANGDLASFTGSYNSLTGFVIEFGSHAAFTINTASLTITSGTIGNTVFSSSGGYLQQGSIYSLSGGGGPFIGGTFTITIFGQTTAAIAYNASSSTVASALNALSEVTDRGNVTVSVSPFNSGLIISPDGNSIGFDVAFSNSLITASATSLLPSGTTITITSGETGTNRIQNVLFVGGPTVSRVIGCPNHGITSADTVYLKSSTPAYFSEITDFTVLTASSIEFPITAQTSFASETNSMTEIGKRTKANYAPGSGSIRGEATTSFYLPGVSVGITTGADVPQVEDQGDPTPFLLATFAGTGNINMSVGQLQPWNGTTILSQEITTIKAEDV